jgi:hypothetical protein
MVGIRSCLLALALALAVVPAADAAERGTGDPAGSTPALIERAADRGQIDRDTATLYLAYAVRNDRRLPSTLRASKPWDGTLVLRRVHKALRRMSPGTRRNRVEDVVTPAAVGTSSCDTSATPTTDTIESDHFYIEYSPALLGGGLDIQDYIDSLEEAWTKEVTDFGWAAPPELSSDPAPNHKYPVRIDALGPSLYGFVSDSGDHAGLVGDNPNTAWSDGDARASCMVLNQDYSTFPSSPQVSLDSTTAHEFNHSLQYGYGALNGVVPDDSFVEGGATWMEDEVQDDANDNYNYLWPDFTFNMGEYGDDPYPYWITFRGLTERYGTGAAGGAEQVMQDFWEQTSQNVEMLPALQQALANKGTNIADAYHAYAVAVRFNKACGGGYAYPYCLEEGPSYASTAGGPPFQGDLTTAGASFDGGVEDNYALNWVRLPATGTYSVTLKNDSPGGELRGSVACDTGTGIQVTPLPAVAGAGVTATLGAFDASACTAGRPFGVITNQAQTADNPDTFTERAYTLSTSGPGTDSVSGGGGTGSQPATGTPSSSPASKPAAKDTTAPLVRLTFRSRRQLLALLRGGLLIRVRSNEAATVKGDLLIAGSTFSRLAHSARRIVVGHGSARLTKAGSKRVRLRLTKRAKRVLRRGGNFSLVLRVRATDKAHNSRTTSRRITVRR